MTSLLAAARLVDAGDGNFGFLATGPAGLKINGSTSAFKASENAGKLTVTVPLTNLNTGIDLRDKHLRGYLDTAQHPNATLEVARSKLSFPADNQTATMSAVGKLTLHGVTRAFPFSYKVKRTGIDYHVQGLGSLDIRDYGIEVPCYLGVCVEPEVKLKVKFKLRDK
jgi:polyisoprenoid-binding protein YceI